MIKHHPKAAVASLKGHHMSKIWHLGLAVPDLHKGIGGDRQTLGVTSRPVVTRSMTIKRPNGEAQDVDCGTDHADDKAVEELFATVARDHGRLDILVNNAAKLVDTTLPAGFWEKPLEAAG
jgi:NAD(P)-dependent dehydrogenase (short-subunit alcohol dehydrogenase family)